MSERRVFTVATVVLLVHALDDALVNRQPGIGVGQHAVAALVALVAGGAAIAAFPSLRPGLRTAAAGLLGVFGLVNGLMHVQHVRADAVAASDITGVVAVAAALALLGLAAAIPYRHRGEREHRRWLARAVALPAGLLAAILVVVPVSMAVVDAHKWREPIGAPPSAAYEPVAFTAADGLRLKGWYHPSRNGAAVLVVHGGNSDRTGSVAHARFLAGAGYGVLLYDARGRGESEGSPNGYGWGWEHDVDGAMRLLAARPDVEAGRVAALGLSTGADVLLDVAPDRDDLAGIVADGSAATSWEDWRRLKPSPTLQSAAGWAMFQALELFTGDDQPEPLDDEVARSTTPLLLISAGRDVEREFGDRYAAAAGGPAEHWNMPDVSHTRGLRARPGEYERRVLAFLGRVLSP
ncbi:MAG: alpha/beta hydrolase [Solirubrobacteraceae bacterium]